MTAVCYFPGGMCVHKCAEPAIWRNSASNALWPADAHTFFNGVPVLSASAAVHADTTTPSFSTVDIEGRSPTEGSWDQIRFWSRPLWGGGPSPVVCRSRLEPRTRRAGPRVWDLGASVGAPAGARYLFRRAAFCNPERDDGLQGRAPRGSHRRLPIFHGLLRGHARLQQARPAPHPRHPDHGERACRLCKRGLTHCSARMHALSRPELSAYLLPSYRTRRSS